MENNFIKKIILQPHNVEVYDLSVQQQYIRQKYGDQCYRIPEAQQELAALWGITTSVDIINNSGVFINTQVIDYQSAQCKAQLRIVEAPNNTWAVSVAYSTSISGYGSAPSISNRIAYLSYEDAKLCSLSALINLLKSVTNNSGFTNTNWNS